MSGSHRRLSVRLWAGVLLAVLALAAVVLPAVGYARAAANHGFALGNDEQDVALPADREYGIYVDDTDNSGYSEQCTIFDADRGEVELHDPWWSTSSSDTEVLDI